MNKTVIPPPTVEQVKESLLKIKGEMLGDSQELTTLIAIKYNKLTELKPLWFIIDEICDCLILNKQCAAMTLTNHLLESSLKLTLVLFCKEKSIEGIEDFDTLYKKEIENFQGDTMKNNLKVAKEKNIINEDDYKDLCKMMIEYRHHISHASNNKYIREARTKIWSYDFFDSSTYEKEVGVTGNPQLNLSALELFMRQEAFRYFTHVYMYITKWDKIIRDKRHL